MCKFINLILNDFIKKIAAISPADINFDETVSTLRYGKVNENN